VKEIVMRSSPDRLARLLEKHPKFYEVAPEGDYTGAIIRRGQFLVPARHASAVEEKARNWTTRRTDLPPLGAAWFTLSGNADVADVIAHEFSLEGQDPLASPVHMFRGEPNYQGGPDDAPAPVVDPLRDPAKGSSSHAVTVAVLDTGLNTQHSWFPKQSWEAVDADVDDVLDDNNDYELDAQAGHGTFIAGIVRQRAPGAHLMISRVLGSDGVCDELELLQALRALQHLNRSHNRRIGVINLSLGAYTWNNQPPPLLSQVIKELSADAVVVAAAGNNSRPRKFWPAADDSVIGVGAVTADGQERTTFSNHGGWVDAWAPGQRVASSFIRFDGPEDKAPNSDIDPDCFTGFATWSGTSFAAPQVAGELARKAQEQKTTPRAVLDDVLKDFPAPDEGASPGSRTP
jgi:subtilisin family serine protease